MLQPMTLYIESSARLISLTAFLIANCSSTFAQSANTNKDTFRQQVELLVQAQYGKEYTVAVEVIDSVLATQDCEDREDIMDPYGTLRGCVLFAGVRYHGNQDSSFLGIYKDRKITWTSDRVIVGVWGSTFAISDINNDGQVDILTTWYTNGDGRMLYLWIMSWDGVKGRIVNQVDYVGRSTILAANFKLVEHDSSGVKDIVGTSASKDALITTFFRWDGTRYILDREIEEPFDDQGRH